MADLPENVRADLAKPSGCALEKYMQNMPMEERFALLKDLADKDNSLSFHVTRGMEDTDVYKSLMDQSNGIWQWSLSHMNRSSVSSFFDSRQGLYGESTNLTTFKQERSAVDEKGKPCEK